jgi:hypothetical protein
MAQITSHREGRISSTAAPWAEGAQFWPTPYLYTTSGSPFQAVNTGDGESPPTNNAPTFVDIDGDGLMDIFVGTSAGTVRYFKNTGTATTAMYTLDTTITSLAGVAVGGGGEGEAAEGGHRRLSGNAGGYATPFFCDIDGDGDFDLFVGSWDGNDAGPIVFYKNTGTATSPTFELQTTANNPLSVVVETPRSAITCADLDGDGDLDCFSGQSKPGSMIGADHHEDGGGEEEGGHRRLSGDADAGNPTVRLWKNSGNVTHAMFVETPNENPFISWTTQTVQNPMPVLVDQDGDGGERE